MRSQVQKWGNSLALRLPESVSTHFGLTLGSEVELSIEEGRLVVIPAPPWSTRLDALLDQIAPDQVHPEIETGGPVGRESW